MDEKRFDQWACAVALSSSRRGVLKTILGGIAATAGIRIAATPSVASPIVARGPNGANMSPSLQEARSTELDYFALGDSIASGHGLEDNGAPCRQSPRAYPFGVAEMLADHYQTVTFDTPNSPNHRFLACSGAPTSNVDVWNATISGVIGGLRGRPTLVSVTIGADDFSFIDAANLVNQLYIASDTDFRTWVRETADGMRERLVARLKLLLEHEKVFIVVTEVYNPFNPTSVFFVFGNQAQCSSRIEYALGKLNGALRAAVETDLKQPERVALATVQNRFRKHWGPKPTCGGDAPGVDDTWVQYRDDPKSNSKPFDHLDLSQKAIAAIVGLLRAGDPNWTGDCIHPNKHGAHEYAKAVIAAALPLLKATVASKPAITSGPNVTEIGPTSVSIAWTTDQPADSTVEYGTSTDFEQSAADLILTTEHQVYLDNLEQGKTYHYRIRSTNDNGAVVSKRDRTFATSKLQKQAFNSPENLAAAAFAAMTDNNLDGIKALYIPGEEPGNWEDVWAGLADPGPDFTGCSNITYSTGSWTTDGACRPTETSPRVTVILYIDPPWCGTLYAGQEGPNIHTVTMQTARTSDRWFLTGSVNLNGNAPEFGQPCVDGLPAGRQELQTEFIGTWEGTGTQTGPSMSLPLQVELLGGQVGSVIGTVTYPSLGCVGELTLGSVGTYGDQVTEHITTGRGICVNGGSATLSISPEGYLVFDWISPNGSSTVVAGLTRADASALSSCEDTCQSESGCQDGGCCTCMMTVAERSACAHIMMVGTSPGCPYLYFTQCNVDHECEEDSICIATPECGYTGYAGHCVRRCG